jgi:formylglycine-generating enzyme required for sulfatase activity
MTAHPELIEVGGGLAEVGSSTEEVEEAVDFWSPRLRRTLLREHPVHPVRIHPFLLERTPVTQADYARFVVLRGGSCALSGDMARSARHHGGPQPGELYKFRLPRRLEP